MSTLYNGGASFGFSLNFNTAVPVDTRFVVATLDDLFNPQTWVSGTYDSSNDANNVYVVYPGLTVVVLETSTIHIYRSTEVNGSSIANPTYWMPLETKATSTDISLLTSRVIEALGLSENGEHVATEGNYTSEAETVVGEIAALDSALKTTNDNIGTAADDETKSTVYGKIAAEKKAREDAIAGLDADFDEKDTDEFVNIKITQTDGVITNVEVGTNDIAAKSSLTGSSTIGEANGVFEVKAKIKYVAATDSVPAHIALVDKNETELSTINVSDIIGNGILSGHSYDSVTGKLTLTFKQADGTTKDSEIDLGKMLDIDDVLIDTNSQKYLSVDLTGAEQSQAVFKALVVKMADVTATNTGLADAADVKDYIDGIAADLEITAEGDDYVGAAKDATDSKKIVVTTNTAGLTVAKDGTNDTTISGTEKTLVDGKEIADKVGNFVDARISEEIGKLDATKSNTGADHVTVQVTQEDGVITGVSVTETDIASAELLGTAADDKTKETAFGKIAKEKDDRETAIQGLSATKTGTGTNVEVEVKEEAGVITGVKVTESYSTVTRIAKDSTTEPSLTVTSDTGLVKGSDLSALKGYTEDAIEKAIDEAKDDINSDIRFEKGTGTNSAVLKDNGNSAVNEGEVAVGKNNVSSTGTEASNKTIFSVGNGTSSTDKSNAMEVRENGDIWINLGSDYKKLQTILSNEIDWYEGN